ncbi:hypothetical protein CPB84DRAFT_1788749 [Gymnopilus junonius]|uniref:Uncharacterized protein n=1 Tax=Gymnopilus junonius TaxID=109634 RepID=A0A9P5TJT8_GYMJU|nr:hypothetical protein CPB84DRAFT_1788749 [Gymnopilus junonius]
MPVSKKITTEMEGRPTLPSIHSLNLPSLPRPRNVKYDNHDNLPQTHTNGMYHHNRQVSTSSSRTSASRNPSPSPSYTSDAESDGDRISPRTPQGFTKFSLVPCPLEDAEALIVVSDTAIGSQAPNYAPQQAKHSFLVMGSSVQRFRNPQRPLAKGARIHPYRVVRSINASDSRRPSVISITAFNSNTQ